MAFLAVLPGENESIARDYAKHYRSSIPHAIDFTYDGVPKFDAGSWPTYVLVDAQGTVVLHLVGLRDRQGGNGNELRLRRVLEEVASEESSDAPDRGVVCKDGICTITVDSDSERPVQEQTPELAATPGGGVWLAFSSDRDGDSNIYLRRVGAKAAGATGAKAKELTVTRSMADDYAPDLAVAADGTVWVVWCSNRSGRYDIYARGWHGETSSGGGWSKEERVTVSEDDAMAPAVAIDGAGRVWVTYTKWNRRFGTSRDRDVFARFRGAEGWSKEIEVSPAEPAIEDHTDPDIIADPESDDAVWVAWSYDYHPSIAKKPLDVDQPTIFARRVGPEGPLSDDIELVGTKGMSLHAIDLWPSLAVDPDGTLWCTYDVAEWSGGRGALLTSYEGSGFATPERLVSTRADFSSPRLAIDEGGTRALVWSQRDPDRWRVFLSYDAGEGWSEPSAPLESGGDLRAPVLSSDTEGRFWLACEEQVGQAVRIRIEEVEL